MVGNRAIEPHKISFRLYITRLLDTSHRVASPFGCTTRHVPPQRSGGGNMRAGQNIYVFQCVCVCVRVKRLCAILNVDSIFSEKTKLKEPRSKYRGGGMSADGPNFRRPGPVFGRGGSGKTVAATGKMPAHMHAALDVLILLHVKEYISGRLICRLRFVANWDGVEFSPRMRRTAGTPF